MTVDPQLVMDLLTMIPGSTIRRTINGWEGIPPGNDGQALMMSVGLPQWLTPPGAGTGGSGAYALVASWIWSTNVTQVPFTGLGGYSDFLVIVDSVSTTVSTTIGLALSTTNGASWHTTLGDYKTINSTGVLVSHSGIIIQSVAGTGPSSAVVHLNACKPVGTKKVIEVPNQPTVSLTTFTDQVNAILFSANAGFLHSGAVQILAR